jgi:hypothetical protein
MLATAPGNTRALLWSTRGKELGLWPRTRVFVGNRASSSPRFNTYSRSSTHLGAARPRPGFFLPFGSLTVGTRVSNLKLGRRDLGPMTNPRFHTPGCCPAQARFFFIVRVFEAWALGLGTCDRLTEFIYKI